MVTAISDTIWEALRCSDCGGGLEARDDGAKCMNCGQHFPYTDHGSLDLHPRKPKEYPINFELGSPVPYGDRLPVEPLSENPVPEVDFSGVEVPRHLTREILSYFPRAGTRGGLMLDLGCGSAPHRQVSTRAGFEWVGIDHDAPAAPLLGDAHSLPFADARFEFVLFVTVLQYLRFPFVAMREVFRVMKPHGTLIGTVAFLEPSHGTSFYHHTDRGTFDLLQSSGFTVKKLAPFRNWTALKALASLGLFFRMPRPVAQSLVAPLELMHSLWWRAGGMLTGRNLENIRLRHFAGSFIFIATRNGT